MATLSELQYELSTLNKLKTDLSGLTIKFGYICDNCSLLNKQLDSNYYLDKSINAISKIKGIDGDLNNYITYINNTIIPSIDSRISSINTEIQNIESQQLLDNNIGG